MINSMYRLILMDISPPNNTGIDIGIMIRKFLREEAPDQPQPYIVMMTSSHAQNDKQREMAMQAGMDKVITKPLFMEDIQMILNAANIDF